MKNGMRLAFAFMTLAGLTGYSAQAAQVSEKPHHDMRTDPMMQIYEADADFCGDVSLEEFSRIAWENLSGTENWKKQELTVSEIADAIVRRRTEERAKRRSDNL